MADSHPSGPLPQQTTHHIPSSPWIPIPDKRIICIEHPAIIRNLDKGIATIGGEDALKKLAASNGNKPMHLRFRPNDPMQPPIESRSVPTNNLLLKITIPRRRKKRRTGDDETPGADAAPKTLREKLKASKGNYKVEAVGMIDKTVRFRDMANFQWNTSRSAFITKMKDTIVDGRYENIRRFELSQDKGDPDSEILPPVTFSNTVIPHTYNFRQNPAVKRALIDGKTALLNFQAAPKTLTPMVHVSIASIPEKPSSVPEYEELDALHKECVDHLRSLFEQRPIWTRRALYNNFPKHLQTMVRFSMAHVAYMWRAGPWRDTCVLYGVDPRQDSKYRKYQSVFFQIETNKTRPSYHSSSNNNNSHIFDGEHLIRDGRCFQLCDVTDPMVQQLINTPNIRKTCDPQDGWYRSSTLSKIKAVMKAKINAISDEKQLTEADYITILEQESEDEDQEAARKAKDAAERESRIEKRRTGLGVKRPRPTKAEKLAAAAAQAEKDVEEEEESDGEWEAELELPTSQGQVDGRVAQMMAALMNQGDIGFDMDDDDEGDFDVLGGDDDSDD